jgi:eukaryotic-like serine/threonine-protein kinase
MTVDQQTPRIDPLLGQVLAERYRVTRKIGEGGMGSVYEAQHVVLNKSVAVKVLREKFLDRPTVAKRLVQEAQLASAIRHEHIIDITDSGATDDGRTFVVMELIEGPSLAELLRREGALTERRALAIARQVVSALGAAHARGIVHRDVKPENILLRADGDFVKVVDFGISKSVRPGEADEVGRLTSTGVVMGTPFYMSPEQARGDEDVDHRIDVYAVGVILYECLTGEVPFRGPNYLGILQRVANDAATLPRALRPELSISEAVERVTMKAMAKVRTERYATMEALGADIDRVLAGEPIDAPAAAARPRGRRFAAVAIGAALVLASGAAAAIAFVVGRHGPRPNAPAASAAPAPVRVKPPEPATPPAARPAAQVKLHVESDPPGAEVRDGDRVYGKTPRDLTLPPGTNAHLSFALDGYDVQFADVKPLADDSLRVILHKHVKQTRARPTSPAAQKTTPAAEPARVETLPNPYGKSEKK